MGRRAEPFTHSPAMKYIVALLACAASTLALADSEFKNVPPLLHKSIQHGGVTAAQFDGGVLRAQLNKAEVTELVYQTFVFHNICAREWYEPQQFASLAWPAWSCSTPRATRALPSTRAATSAPRWAGWARTSAPS